MTIFRDEKVGINVLLLNVENPRLPPAKNQQEAIDQMLKLHEGKIRHLARHIHLHGLNPSTVPIVFHTAEGKYIVKDGNRRITAIKCIMYPNIVKNNPKLKKYFTKLNKTIDRKEFQYIDCKVSDDEGEINRWIEINHQGEQGGIGQTRWDSIAKARHLKSIGQTQPNLELFDYLMKELPQFSEGDIDYTTYERIINNSSFKEAIGMELTGNQIVFKSEKGWLRDFEEIFNDMTSSKDSENYIDSRSLNTAQDIAEYIKKKKSKGFFKSDDSENPSIILFPEPKSTATGTKKKRTRTRRKITIIEDDCDIIFPKPRMNEMLEGLKFFDLRKYCNSASAVFRTLFELTTKYYYEQMPKPEGEASDRHVKVPVRIEKILKHLSRAGKISEDAKRSMEQLIRNKEPIVQEFNEFGHNYEYNPTPESLVNLWGSMRSFMEAMYPPEEELGESSGD